MNQAVDHVGDDKGQTVRIAFLAQFVSASGDRLAEGTVLALGKVTGGIGAVRHFGEEQVVQLGIVVVGLDQGIDHGDKEFLQGSRGMPDHDRLDGAIDLLHMALMQRSKDRALIRKVLVHRPDADARDLRDAVGVDRGKPFLLEDADDGFEDRLHGLAGAALPGTTAGIGSWQCVFQNMSKSREKSREARKQTP